MFAEEATNHDNQEEPPTKQVWKEQGSTSLDQMFAEIAENLFLKHTVHSSFGQLTK